MRINGYRGILIENPKFKNQLAASSEMDIPADVSSCKFERIK
jgi:hypothetical protein